MRTRESIASSAISFDSYLSGTGADGGPYSTHWGSDTIVNGTYRSMMDVVTPDYKRRSALGEIFNSPMYSYTGSFTSTPSTVEFTGVSLTGSPYNCHYVSRHAVPGGNILRTVPWNPEPIGWALDLSGMSISVNRAWSNLNLAKAALLSSLGEMSETIAFVVSTIRKAINLLRSLITGRWSNLIPRNFSGFKGLDRSSDLWLEARYALRPLIYEVFQALEALQTQLKASRFTARGWHRTMTTSTEMYEVTFLNNTLDGPRNVAYESSIVYNDYFRAGVLARIDDDINSMMAIWGLDQPFETIWELTPFSFILDWFFTIGDVIGAWAPQAGITPLTSWCVYTQEEKESVSVKSFDASPCTKIDHSTAYSGFSLDAGEYSYTSRKTMRVVDPPKTLIPQLNIKLDLFKLTDITLIGRQVLKGIF